MHPGSSLQQGRILAPPGEIHLPEADVDQPRSRRSSGIHRRSRSADSPLLAAAEPPELRSAELRLEDDDIPAMDSLLSDGGGGPGLSVPGVI
jgi:hypothetical protein